MTNHINKKPENSLLDLRNIKILERWTPVTKQKQKQNSTGKAKASPGDLSSTISS